MITLDVKTMRRALSGFSKLNLRTLKNPILQAVRFTAQGGTLRLSATDLDQTLEFSCRGTAHEDGDFLIPLEKLRSCCKGEKAGTRLHFHPEADRHLIHIDDGSVTSEIASDPLPVGKYPDTPATDRAMTEIPAAGVRAIREATGSASTDPTRAILNSVLLQPDNVVATNGRILYRSNSLSLDIKDSLIVPAQKAIRLLDPEAPAMLYGPSNGKAREHRLEQGEWSWTFRAVDGTYPNYSQVLPKNEETRTVIELSDADLELLERLARLPFTREKDALAGLRRAGNELRLMIGRGKDRQVYALKPDSIEGGRDAEVFFNYNFLLEGLKHGLRTLTIKDELDPLILKDAHRVQLFMPLRHHAEPGEWKITQSGVKTDAKPAPANAREPKAAPKLAAESVSAPVKTAPMTMAPDRPQGKAEEPDGIQILIEDATQLRDSLKESLSGLGRLLKTARRVSRERSDLEREHLTLKRSIRSLQKIEV